MALHETSSQVNRKCAKKKKAITHCQNPVHLQNSRLHDGIGRHIGWHRGRVRRERVLPANAGAVVCRGAVVQIAVAQHANAEAQLSACGGGVGRGKRSVDVPRGCSGIEVPVPQRLISLV